MRQWNTDPKVMCTKHLNGEHVEHHMFVGTINKGKSIKGYIEKGLVEVHKIKERHDELAREINRRAKLKGSGGHNSELPNFNSWVEGYVDSNKSLEELRNRCSECRKLQDEKD